MGARGVVLCVEDCRREGARVAVSVGGWSPAERAAGGLEEWLVFERDSGAGGAGGFGVEARQSKRGGGRCCGNGDRDTMPLLRTPKNHKYLDIER